MVSTIIDAVAVARETYQRPEVRFLTEKQHGPFILGLFTTTFTTERPLVPVEEFYERIDQAIAVLHDHGESDLPSADARTLAGQWVAGHWLVKTTTAEGRHAFQVSAASQAALSWLAAREHRRMVSASRVSAILDLVSELAALADPNVEEAIAEHERKAAEHTAEAQRLRHGGALAAGTEDDLLERADRIGADMDALPADFARVGEYFTSEYHRIREQMLTGTGTPGVLMNSVTAAADQITTNTLEGRAFNGAAELINSPAVLGELRGNIARIMSSPLAEVFTHSEQMLFGNIAATFVSNVGTVLTGPRAMSSMVTTRLQQHTRAHEDHGRDEALRAARAALLNHPGAPPQHVWPSVARLHFGSLMLALPDLGATRAPRALTDAPVSRARPMSVEELRRWGGPRVTEIADHLETVIALTDGPVTLADAWASAGEDLHRSVELLAYLTHATRTADTGQRDRITVTDGHTQRVLDIPRVLFTTAGSTEATPREHS